MSTTTYEEFLSSKAVSAAMQGTEVDVSDVNPKLFEWQREIVAWAVRTGRAAIWADTGLGKTFMAVEWARLIGLTVLTIAPLAVTQQTIREAAKLGVAMRYVRDQSEINGPGQYITNYEMAEHFDADVFDGVVLDEASILKNSTGATRNRLIAQFQNVPHRLACTATPAPNDPEELTNQAEFLGRSTRVNMLAAYFVHDSDGWRLKGHARRPMIAWMATWAHALAFQSKNRDSATSRPALADYLLIFKKPGDNAVPIKHLPTSGEVTNDDWIEWASPIWFDHEDGGWLTADGNISPVWLGIKETDTLNTKVAKESADERHIAPLQLGFIDRCVRLYSNPGETVLTPFGGIGSELYQSIKRGRKAIGIELKPSYWRTAVNNLTELESAMNVPTLMGELEVPESS